MRYLLPIITLVLGLIIGAWVPQSELRVVKNEMDRMKKENARVQQSKGNNPIVGNVTQMLGMQSLPEQKSSAEGIARRSSNSPRPKPDLTFDDTGKEESPSPQEMDTVAGPAEGETPPAVDHDFYEAIELARDAWRVRAAHSRQVLSENLELTDREMESFDRTIVEMNNKLEDQIIDLAESMITKEEITTEDGLVMLHSVSGVLLETYTGLDDVLPPDWRFRTGTEADLINFIDPVVATPLGNLQDKNFRNQLP